MGAGAVATTMVLDSTTIVLVSTQTEVGTAAAALGSTGVGLGAAATAFMLDSSGMELGAGAVAANMLLDSTEASATIAAAVALRSTGMELGAGAVATTMVLDPTGTEAGVVGATTIALVSTGAVGATTVVLVSTGMGLGATVAAVATPITGMGLCVGGSRGAGAIAFNSGEGAVFGPTAVGSCAWVCVGQGDMFTSAIGVGTFWIPFSTKAFNISPKHSGFCNSTGLLINAFTDAATLGTQKNIYVHMNFQKM